MVEGMRDQRQLTRGRCRPAARLRRRVVAKVHRREEGTDDHGSAKTEEGWKEAAHRQASCQRTQEANGCRTAPAQDGGTVGCRTEEARAVVSNGHEGEV